MSESNVINRLVEIEKNLHDLINPKNRPMLGLEVTYSNIVRELISSSVERKQFLDNPSEFLKTRGVSVPTGKLVSTNQLALTSEIISIYFVANAVAIASAYVGFGLGAYSYAGMYNYTYMYSSTGTGGSCFLPDTVINSKHSKTEKICEIKVGDKVLSYNQEKDKLEYNPVSHVHMFKQPSFYIINGHLKVTPNHPFFVNGKWEKIKNIAVGETLLDSQFRPVKIDTKELVNNEATVYNLTVDNAHTYFANDLLAHNKEPIPLETNVGWDLGNSSTMV